MRLVWKNTSEQPTEMKKVGLAGSPPLKGIDIDYAISVLRIAAGKQGSLSESVLK